MKIEKKAQDFFDKGGKQCTGKQFFNVLKTARRWYTTYMKTTGASGAEATDKKELSELHQKCIEMWSKEGRKPVTRNRGMKTATVIHYFNLI